MSTLVTEMPLQSHTTASHKASTEKDAVSIFAIIVIYKMRPDESATVQTLMRAIDAVDPATLKLSVFIADNTPGGQPVKELPPAIRYQAFPENPGLVAPYNLAIAQAKQEGYRWLLTLDQDTHLPPGYLANMVESVRRYEMEEHVAAIVPRIVDNGIPISPIHFAGGFFPRVLGYRADGLLARHSSALNSASLLRISALTRVGGYDDRFPLNNSDTALFHRLDVAGYRIALAHDTVVQHELAIMQRADRMTLDRYRQLLIDERDFWDLHMSSMARAERLLRLMGRLVKGVIGNEDAAFRQVTLREIKTRLFTRRATPLKQIASHGSR